MGLLSDKKNSSNLESLSMEKDINVRPSMNKEWDKFLGQHNYQDTKKEKEYVIELLKLLSSGCDIKEAERVFNNQHHFGDSSINIAKNVFKFSIRGEEFANAVGLEVSKYDKSKIKRADLMYKASYSSDIADNVLGDIDALKEKAVSMSDLEITPQISRPLSYIANKLMQYKNENISAYGEWNGKRVYSVDISSVDDAFRGFVGVSEKEYNRICQENAVEKIVHKGEALINADKHKQWEEFVNKAYYSDSIYKHLFSDVFKALEKLNNNEKITDVFSNHMCNEIVFQVCKEFSSRIDDFNKFVKVDAEKDREYIPSGYCMYENRIYLKDYNGYIPVESISLKENPHKEPQVIEDFLFGKMDEKTFFSHLSKHFEKFELSGFDAVEKYLSPLQMDMLKESMGNKTGKLYQSFDLTVNSDGTWSIDKNGLSLPISEDKINICDMAYMMANDDARFAETNMMAKCLLSHYAENLNIKPQIGMDEHNILDDAYNSR